MKHVTLDFTAEEIKILADMAAYYIDFNEETEFTDQKNNAILTRLLEAKADLKIK